ncbi:MAG: SMC-Scp complex subunit ScpB [Thermomicrobiales bacterium]|nr:SMC-Scp complex subunit ScpB [Thermomicrobiales bacterium]
MNARDREPGASVARQAPLDDPDLDDAELAALIEAMLLVAPEPTSSEQLAQGAGVPRARIENTLAMLDERTDRGWVLIRNQGRLQLASAPRFAGRIRRFLGLEREARLSPAALETLAIIAYRQPTTRGEIEAVRGVDCSGVLATLHGRGLISAAGRRPVIGAPIEYATTPEFLRHFGLASLSDLPELGEIGGTDAAELLSAALADAPDADGGVGLPD